MLFVDKINNTYVVLSLIKYLFDNAKHAPRRLGQSYYTKLNNMKLSRNGQTKLKFLLLYYLPLRAYSSPE